jgi:hypothetical protein
MRLSLLLTLCFALLFAGSVPAQTNSGVNNAQLHGNYAFTFSGISGNTSISNAYAAVGTFTADGAGNLTSGELDTNGVGPGALTAQPFTGTYSIGADNRGVMTMDIGGSPAKLAFAMVANGSARFIKFDAAGGSGTIGSGAIEPADTTAYSTARIAGDYAFGVAGFDNLNNRAAIVSRFTANAAGTFANAAGDLNGYGTSYSMSFTSATYTVSDATHGRGTMNLAFLYGGAPGNLNFVFYVVNAGRAFVMARDLVSSSTPLLSGALVQQHNPAGGFTNASLNGNMVIYLTGSSACGSGNGVPKAVAGLLTSSGNGAFSLTYDENYCRAPGGNSGLAGTYAVAGNGRAALALGGYHLIGYLIDSNQIFLFASDANVLFGFGEPQAAGSYTNSALQGSYAGSATTAVDFAVNAFSGEFNASGGNLTGTEDIGASSGPVAGAAFNASYSVTGSPTNGRGTMNITSGSGGTAVIYMISSSKFVVVPLSDPNPSVWLFEGASTTTPPPPPAAATLSTLTVNPASVIGGSETSTGSVTLSAPAPSGGAVVALSSSNASVATVPSSVTVAAGSTSASFTVATGAVASSTTVAISASYAGVTKSASLTVTPQPPTLSSLTLNPSSVFGGLQSSTGTVTLTAPAPAGGAQVALSSNNSAASVPSSVTIPAGATTGSFTVSTSAVLFSTSATISAAYNNTTRSATLSIW